MSPLVIAREAAKKGAGPTRWLLMEFELEANKHAQRRYVNDEFCRILCDRLVLCIFQMHVADPRILIRMCWCEEHPTMKSVVHPNWNARHFGFVGGQAGSP